MVRLPTFWSGALSGGSLGRGWEWRAGSCRCTPCWWKGCSLSGHWPWRHNWPSCWNSSFPAGPSINSTRNTQSNTTIHVHVCADLSFNSTCNTIKYNNTCTVKHVYRDHAYNEMPLIMKRLWIPGEHCLFLCINFMLTAKTHITKLRL